MTAGATGEMINDPIPQHEFMARRSRRMKNKIEPSVMTFAMSFPIQGNTAASKFLDFSQFASIINRRFYRQGLNWAAAGFKVLNVSGIQGAISISRLPNTWVMNNAWTKGFRTWQKMNNEALAETESIRPKFLDFKIYADSTHHGAGYALNLLPLSGSGVVGKPGEWEPSKVVIPTSATGSGTTDFEIIACGANFPGTGASTLNAVSLIEGYAASRGLPNILDPNTPADADDVGPTATPENWLASIFNEGTDQDKEVLEEMISENNVAPYPFENGPDLFGGAYTDTQYPGGANQLPGLEFHDVEYFTPTTISNTVRLKGGNFPCGLVRFDVSNQSPEQGTITILVDMIPGTHRGYLCESMLEA